MQIDAVFSGHSHTSKVISMENMGFNTFIGGGDSLDENEFKAIKVKVTDESLKIHYVTPTGDVVEEYEVKGEKQK